MKRIDLILTLLSILVYLAIAWWIWHPVPKIVLKPVYEASFSEPFLINPATTTLQSTIAPPSPEVTKTCYKFQNQTVCQ